MIKTGKQHIASLQDGRQVFIDGGLVKDVTSHPAYRRSVASVGRMFDSPSEVTGNSNGTPPAS